jgi:2-dehydropantoate 2-reductase
MLRRRILRILIVGAGSTGGYFGGRLAEAGRDVTFLVRKGRAAQLRQGGLRIASPHGDVSLAPQLVTADTIGAPYDAVLLTVKAYSLSAALEDLAPAIGPDTMILPVLNGMRHMDQLVGRFGAGAVVGCVCKVATVLDEEGRIRQLAPMQELSYGEINGSLSARMQRLDDTMRDAGFDARLSTTIERDMWEKWVMLASLGGITCLMRGHVGEVNAAPGGRDFILALLAEVVAAVTALGHPPGEKFLSAIQSGFTAPTSTQTSSMFRDLQKGAAVEADQILGDLVARGTGAGVAMPLLSAAYAQLSIYQKRVAGP